MVFYRGANGGLWASYGYDNSNGATQGLAATDMGPSTGSGMLASAPSVVSRLYGALDASGTQVMIFYRGGNGHLWVTQLPGSTSTAGPSTRDLNVAISNQPTAVYEANAVTIYARDLRGNVFQWIDPATTRKAGRRLTYQSRWMSMRIGRS